MTKTEFKRSMIRGLGSCILALEESDDIECFRPIVLYGCLHNTAYDTQCEGTRAEYMYVLQSKFEDDYFLPYIIDKFLKSTKDSWLFEMLCELLIYFALDGEKSARTALYDKFHFLLNKIAKMKSVQYNPIYEQFEWLCIHLVSLDGWKALKTVVRTVGDTVNLSYFYEDTVKKYNQKKVMNFLQKDALSSKETSAFLSAVTAEKTPSAPRATREYDLDFFLQSCKNDTSPFRKDARLFSKNATAEDLNTIAAQVLTETNTMIKVRLLSVFHFVKFPLNPSVLIQCAHSETEELRTAATEALEQIRSASVHDCGIELLKEDHLYEALSCLLLNYKPSDEILLLDAMKAVPVHRWADKWHGIFNNALALCERNKKAPVELLLYMYKTTLCSMCRYYTLQELDKRKALTTDLLMECLYDSYDETRSLAKKRLKHQQG